MIDKGDIIRIKTREYVEFEGRPWHEHFVDATKLLVVVRSETNNGNMLATDSKGILYHVHANEVIEVRRKST